MADHDERAEPPRKKKFTSPDAEVVWPAITALGDAAQHELLIRLSEYLAVAEDGRTPQGLRLARAVGALREAHVLLLASGRPGPLSVEEYRALRIAHPDAGWPPDSSIRRWTGGSWNDALRRARLDVVPGGDAIGIPLGGSFTREEAADAVLECATDLGYLPTFQEYLGWVRREDVMRRPGRRPMSQPVFDRIWPGGGWLGALRFAGLLADGDDSANTNALPVRPSAYRYSTEQLIESLLLAANDLGCVPRTAQYQAWRQARLAADPTRPIPGYVTLLRVWETWDLALVAAGLAPHGGRATGKRPTVRRRRPDQYPEQMLREVLAEAYAAVGAPFTSSAYKRWRKQQIQRDRDERRLRRLPAYDVLHAKYGTWSEAVRQLLGDQHA